MGSIGRKVGEGRLWQEEGGEEGSREGGGWGEEGGRDLA